MAQELRSVLDAREPGVSDCARQRRSQVWSRLYQLDQVLDDPDMRSRLFPSLIGGAGRENDNREHETQHVYPPPVAEEHTQCSVRPRSRLFCHCVPPANIPANLTNSLGDEVAFSE